MKLNGTSGVNLSAGTIGMNAGIGGQTDPMVRDLQRQIEDLKNQMKELSANAEMPPEIKSKKRQELQKQISDLEVQLRQRQMEVKREEAMKKRQENYSMDEMLGTKQQTNKLGKQSTGLSAGSMEAMISADVSVKLADMNGSVAQKMEGKAGVLEAEIKLDGGVGAAPEGKEEALAEVKAKANEATSAQMSMLARAEQEASKVTESEQEQNAFGIEEKDEKSVSGTKESRENTDENVDSRISQIETGNTFDAEQLGVPFSRGYNPVDVEL